MIVCSRSFKISKRIESTQKVHTSKVPPSDVNIFGTWAYQSTRYSRVMYTFRTRYPSVWHWSL